MWLFRELSSSGVRCWWVHEYWIWSAQVGGVVRKRPGDVPLPLLHPEHGREGDHLVQLVAAELEGVRYDGEPSAWMLYDLARRGAPGIMAESSWGWDFLCLQDKGMGGELA